MKLILASQSVNRRRLLEQAGVDFEVVVSGYEEDMSLDMTPEELVVELSKGKAEDVARLHPERVVLGADTVFVLDGHVGGKPKDNEAAFRLLNKLRMKPHSFITGFAIVHHASGRVATGTRSITLRMRDDLTDADIKNYIAREREPVTTKAGGYDGLNMGIGLIESFDGDYGAALGLPVGPVLKELKKFDVNPLG